MPEAFYFCPRLCYLFGVLWFPMKFRIDYFSMKILIGILVVFVGLGSMGIAQEIFPFICVIFIVGNQHLQSLSQWIGKTFGLDVVLCFSLLTHTTLAFIHTERKRQSERQRGTERERRTLLYIET